MARKLTRSVWLRDPKSDEMMSFTPGAKLPEWAQRLTEGKDHLFESADEDENTVELPLPRDRKTDLDYSVGGPAVGKEPAATEDGKSELTEGDESEEGVDEQPKGNASREAWALFAAENGVPVTDDMGRDDIKAAAVDAGVIE